MKKTLAFLLALLLTFTMLPVSAFAAENPTFSVSSATGKAGDEVTVVVEIENNPGIWAYNYGIEYDTTRLEKVSYTGGGMDGGIWTINEKVLWESSTFENSTYNGETLVMKFKIKEDAPAGDAEIKIKDDFFACNCDGNIVNADLVAGKVTVEGKLETVIPLTKDNHDENSENIRADKYGNVGGLKIEGVKLVDWTQWKQGGNYQTQSITIYVDPESKDDIATLSLVLLNGQTGRGPLIDNPATVDVQLNNGAGSYSNNYTFIGTGGLAPKLNLVITFELAKEECEHQWKDATCTEPKTCELCFATEGEALGHDWNVTYKWSDDGKACTATRVCQNDAAHTESAEATVTSEVEKEPTCTESGITKYTATFDVDWAETQTNSKADTEALGHDYEAVVTEPTCTEGGYTTYTCSACGDSYVADEVPALGHDWEVSYEWAEDGKSCTATRVCQNDAEHVETAEAAITSVVAKPATCVTMGDTQYTATFAEDWAETQHEAVTDIPVDEDYHEWGEWKVVREATYEEKGLKERECKLCEDKENDDIPKLTKPSEPSKPSKPSDKPNPGVTIIVPGDKGEEEKNPNTGAPVFDMTFAGVVVLAATATVLEIKRRK